MVVRPVPLSVIGRATASEKPPRSRPPPVSVVPVSPSGVAPVAPAEPSFRMPAVIVVVPVKVLAPETVQVPTPCLVSVPDPVVRAPANVEPVPVPSSVRLSPAPLTAAGLDRMMLPFATMLAVAASVSWPP